MLFKEEDFASGDLTEVFCTMKDIEIECSLFIMLSCYYIAIIATKLLLKKRQKKAKKWKIYILHKTVYRSPQLSGCEITIQSETYG